VKDGNVHTKDNGLILTGVKSHEALNADAIDSRLNEQISRGLINKLNGGYELTLRGSLMVKIADILSILFKLQGWNENKH
jgi:predicted transcriptional regulator